MKKILFSLLFLSSLSVFGQETWNVCNSTVNVIPQPSYDSTFVLSAPSRAALAKGMASWTPATSSGASYLVYTALLTQTGTDAPVATVLENTLGGTVVWSRLGGGTYRATLSNVFTSGKTVYPVISLVGAPVSDAGWSYISSSVQELQALDDNTINNWFIEIRVYP